MVLWYNDKKIRGSKMKIKIIIASTIALVSFSNACIDNPECKADLKKCKQGHTGTVFTYLINLATTY